MDDTTIKESATTAVAPADEEGCRRSDEEEEFFENDDKIHSPSSPQTIIQSIFNGGRLCS